MRDTVRFDPADRFHLMLFLALILHLLVLLCWGFKEAVLKATPTVRELEIISNWQPADHDPIAAFSEAPLPQSGLLSHQSHLSNTPTEQFVSTPVMEKGMAPKQQRDATAAYASARAEYLVLFKQKIETTGLRGYPKDLIGNGFYRLMVEITLGASGELLNLCVLKSSKHAHLDEAALQIIRRSAPFPAVPVSLQGPNGTLKLVRALEFGSR